MAEAEFPVARCTTCGKVVLCYLALDGASDADAEVVRCVDCSMRVSPEAVRWLGFHDIEELGFGLVIPEGGCGRPDCGRGRCGTSG